MEKLRALGREMRDKYPEPDDGLTDAEWIHQQHIERAERIARNAEHGETEA
jgi:hypothetical protein